MVEHNLNRTPHTHTHIHIRTHTHIRNNTPAHIYMHRDNNKTICSTQNRIQNTTQRTQNNAQNSTENTCTQPQRTENSAHNYRTYSLDYYFEFAYIKNSNTIELYTILQDKV